MCVLPDVERLVRNPPPNHEMLRDVRWITKNITRVRVRIVIDHVIFV